MRTTTSGGAWANGEAAADTTSPRLRLLAAVTAGFAFAALVLMILGYPRQSTVIHTAMKGFSYYTVIANLLVLFDCAMIVSGARSSARSLSYGRALVAIVLVFFVSASQDMAAHRLVSRDPAILAAHYGTPILAIVTWAVMRPRSPYRWGDLASFSAPAALYLAYVLARGHFTRCYPYDWINPIELGAAAVARNLAIVALANAALGLALILISRRIVRGRGAGQAILA